MRIVPASLIALAVLLGLGPHADAQTPRIKSLGPVTGPPGQSVNVIGSGFDKKGRKKGEQAPKIQVFLDEHACLTQRRDAERLSFRSPHTIKAGKYKVVVQLGDPDKAKKSNPKFFTVTPALKGLNPPRGEKGALITVTGAAFTAKVGALKPVVLWDDKPVSTTVLKENIIQFKVPNKKPGRYKIQVRLGGKDSVSEARYFQLVPPPKKYKAPVISGLKPPRGKPGDSVTAKGVNFRKGMLIYIGKVRASTRWKSEKEMTFTIPDKIVAGLHDIIAVMQQGKKTQKSKPKKFTIAQHQPKISGLKQVKTVPGAPCVILGTGFGVGIQIYFDGLPVKTGRGGYTSCSFQIPVKTKPGGYPIHIMLGEVKSNGTRVTVVALKPKVLKLRPEEGEPGKYIGLQGEQFGFHKSVGAKVLMNNVVCPTEWHSDRGLRFLVPESLKAGSYQVWVQIGTGPGSPKSNKLKFKVLKVVPVVDAINPNPGAVGKSVVVQGRGYLEGSVVKLNGKPMPTVRNSFRRLTFDVTEDLEPGKTYQLTVFVPGAKATKPQNFTVKK